MASLRIPERHKSSLVKLAKFSSETWRALLSALEQAQPVLNPDALIRSVVSKVKGLSQDELEPIIVVLLSLTIVRTSRGESLPEFVESLVTALKRDSVAGEAVSKEQEQNLRQRLAEALNLDRTLGLAAKARDVIGEQERFFCDARILTDIRPIFMDKVTDQPTAGVIVHTLKIAHHVGGELRDFFVAMDTEDLGKLGAQIERAVEKGAAIRTFLKKAGITYLDFE